MDDQEKQEFLREFGDFYDYPNAPKTVDQTRATEFKRLNGQLLLSLCSLFSSIVYQTELGQTFISSNSLNRWKIDGLFIQVMCIWITLERHSTLSCRWKRFSRTYPPMSMEILVSTDYLIVFDFTIVAFLVLLDFFNRGSYVRIRLDCVIFRINNERWIELFLLLSVFNA